MVFRTVFTTTQSISEAGTTLEQGIDGYIPKTPAEFICIPPHDPSQPLTPGPQDPKIVRETSPQAQAVFEMINVFSRTMGTSAVEQNTVSGDPSTTVSTASSIVSHGGKTTRQYAEDVSKPDVNDFPKPDLDRFKKLLGEDNSEQNDGGKTKPK
ncbi:hypothetical protein [Burkholderia cepacia]|uniref:hypothetical protein n=1 Tax=Burkholderia cepacia TaxID=292 RepID=UPI0018C8CC4C|nr:hypothetical protein [Burkholderia cepacia]